MSEKISKKLHILKIAAEILETEGMAGLTTRAVQDKAGVTAPTIYHHFHDKDGLVMALIGQGIEEFFRRKLNSQIPDDPIAQLRQGWDIWLHFAFERPQLFQLMIDHAKNHPELLQKNYELMRMRVQRLQQAGHLVIEIEAACRILWAASSGLMALFDLKFPREQIEATSDHLFEAVLAKLTKPR